MWLHLRKERFPSKRKEKLMPRAVGPFKVLARYSESAYKLEFPDDYGGISATFNVGDLSPYLDDQNLRANSLKEGEDDGGASLVPLTLPSPPITPQALGFMRRVDFSPFVTLLTWSKE